MNKTFLRASLIAMFGLVSLDSGHFMNVMAAEETQKFESLVGAEGELKNQIIKCINPGESSKVVSEIMPKYMDFTEADNKPVFQWICDVLADENDVKGRLLMAFYNWVSNSELNKSNKLLDLAKIIANDNVGIFQELVTDLNYDLLDIALRMAALAGAEKIFKWIVINGSNGMGVDRLFEAALAGGDYEIIHICEQNGLLESFDGKFDKIMPFIKVEVFDWLLNRGNISMSEVCDDEPLLVTMAKLGRLNFVKYLVEQGHAHVEAKDKDAWTPLIWASCAGHLDIVKYLVEQGHADVEAKNLAGCTPLITATIHRHLDIVKYLVKQGHADVKSGDKYGGTPLIRASTQGYLDIVKYLVEQGHADVEAKNNDGYTSLIGACRSGNMDVVKYLVEECKANVEAKNNDGYTPLIWASKEGFLDIVKCLVEQGHADVEAKNNDGYTPLIWASCAGHLDIVKYLVEQGHANANTANNEGDTPHMWASIMMHTEIRDYLSNL